MKSNRRSFLKAAAGGLVSVTVLPGFASTSFAAVEGGQHGISGKHGLELDGVFAGWLHSAAGGSVAANVITEKLGDDAIAKKPISGSKYEPITLTCGAGMSRSFYDWLKDSFDQKNVRKNGAILSADYDNKELSRLSFLNALISEVELPACDAASKDAARMTVRIQPEETRFAASPGGGALITNASHESPQKQWLPANFRLRIDGLDDACAHVNKIDAITLKQQNGEDITGQAGKPVTENPGVKPSNLVIVLPESHADALFKWHQDFVIKGNDNAAAEKNGSLEYLAPNLQDVLFRVRFSRLGIFNIAPEKVEAGAESIKRVKAEMFCQSMTFEYPQGGA